MATAKWFSSSTKNQHSYLFNKENNALDILSVIISCIVISLYIFRSQEVFGVSSLKYSFISAYFVILWLLQRVRLKINYASILFLVFSLLCSISCFYTLDLATGGVNALFVFVSALYLIFLINVKVENTRFILKEIILIILLYVLIFFYLGGLEVLEEKEYSYNKFAFNCFLGIVAALFLYVYSLQIKYYIISLLLALIVLYAGSVKTFIASVIILIAALIFSKKRKKFLIFVPLSMIIVSLSLCWLFPDVLNRGFLRITNTILWLVNEELAEQRLVSSSGLLRMELIEYGTRLIAASPFFGYGIDSFRHIAARDFGFYSYSHNDLIEVLTSVGFSGFVIYISIFVAVIVSIMKNNCITFKEKGYSMSVMFVYALISLGQSLYNELALAIVIFCLLRSDHLRNR